jgi:hypothetical protein
MNEKNLKLLYRSFDVPLSPDEQEQLNKALDKSQELRKELEKLRVIRKNVAASKELSFKPFFAERVMQQINKISMINYYDILYQSLARLFKPVLVTAILLIIAISTYNITNTRQISLEGALAVPRITLEQAFDPSLSLYMEE